MLTRDERVTALRDAENEFVAAARERRSGDRYQRALESLLAAYDALLMGRGARA